MKKFYTTLCTTLLLVITTFSYSQSYIKLKAAASIGGASLERGSEFDYTIYGNGNNDNQTRQLLFDIQYDQVNFELVSVSHTGTGGNGGILPQSSNPIISYYNYPGYNWLESTSGSSANNTANGSNNYQYANYAYNQNNTYAILRATLTWSTTAAMPYNSYSDFIKIRFRLKAASTAYTFNPIKLNFVAAWNNLGNMIPTIMETPLLTAVNMNQNYGKYTKLI